MPGPYRVEGTAGGTPIAVTGGGGGVEYTDRDAFTESVSGGVKPAGYAVNDTPAAAVAEDEIAVARMTPQRAAHANLRNAVGTEIGTLANPVRIEPVGGTAQPVDQGTAGPAAAAWTVHTPFLLGGVSSVVRDAAGYITSFDLSFAALSQTVTVTRDSQSRITAISATAPA